MRTQIQFVHGRTMKSSKTNFVAAAKNTSRFGANEMRANNAAIQNLKNTQVQNMNKMVEDRVKVQKEAIVELVTPSVSMIFTEAE